MAGLDEMWTRFTLSEVEDGGAEITRQEEIRTHRLTRKFLTKRILNVDAMADTFKPLWRPFGELKIRDVGKNILLFEFQDNLDLERVLESEPWSYDKSLVIFQRAADVDWVPSLDFSHTTFWLQIHNVPECLLRQATGESVGKSLGNVIQVADPEDHGAKDSELKCFYRKGRPFCFESMWLKDSTCEAVVKDSWGNQSGNASTWSFNDKILT
nr:hypothetical protein CFP56_74690 [Quercus suber]